MVKTLPYKNLNDTLKHFKVQVIEGIPYAKKNLPEFTDPQQIFDYLKLRTKYKHDPEGTELFQTLPTLLENNYHGMSGLGDCDCFSIALCSVLAANDFKNFGIVLVGRNRLTPVHIYCYVIDANGEKKYLDLTNKYYDQTRNYPYRQEIPFNLTPKEKQNMILELADGAANRRRKRAKPTPEQLKKYQQSTVYKRKRAAYLKKLQQDHQRKVQQGRRMRPNANHIWLPSRNMQIREDAFDTLHENDFQTMLLSEGYQLEEITELSGRRGERRRAKKDEKRALKKEKKLSKVELRRARAQKKKDAGEAKKTRAQAKQDKANRKRGGGEDGEDEGSDAENTAGRIFGKVIGGAKQAIGVYKSARGGGGDEEGGGGDQEGGEGSGDNLPTRRGSGDQAPAKTINLFGKEIKQSTAILAGLGLAAAATITVIAINKNKNKRRAAA